MIISQSNMLQQSHGAMASAPTSNRNIQLRIEYSGRSPSPSAGQPSKTQPKLPRDLRHHPPPPHNPPMDHLKQLQSFVSVAARGSLTAAARAASADPKEVEALRAAVDPLKAQVRRIATVVYCIQVLTSAVYFL